MLVEYIEIEFIIIDLFPLPVAMDLVDYPADMLVEYEELK